MPPIVHSLKPFFRSGINMRNYGALITAAKVKTLGKLPNDLLNIVSKSSENGLSKDLITYLNSSYEEAVKILKKIEKAEVQAFCRIPATDKKYIETATLSLFPLLSKFYKPHLNPPL